MKKNRIRYWPTWISLGPFSKGGAVNTFIERMKIGALTFRQSGLGCSLANAKTRPFEGRQR